MNKLYFGDNLDVLRGMPIDSVNLIYLDPPFNSKADYGVIYGTKRGGPSQAQSHAFKDMWTWGPDAKRALNQTAERHLEVGALLDSFQKIFPDSNMLAYLAMMAVRLIEMHRVLKATGSLYLHCDPTASHYLKILLDSVFGPVNFRNEIVWKRRYGSFSAVHESHKFGAVTDTILFYVKSDDAKFHPQYSFADPEYMAYVERTFKHVDEQGRRYRIADLANPAPRPNLMYEYKGYKPPPNGWAISLEKMKRWDEEGRLHFPRSKTGRIQRRRFFDELKGKPVQSLWDDIDMLSSQDRERLGYPTQKPLALLERIIQASSDEGDLVLDPFCGCGTAIEAAEKLHRQWIGIDVTYLAIHVIEARMLKAFGPSIEEKYRLFGRPKDADDARVLAARDWLEFQKWAVFSLGGLPKERPGADGGIDGIIRYHRVGVEQPNRAVVSVKGGQHVGVDAVHKLKSVVQREKAEIGILVCLDRPTSAMEKEVLSEGEVGPASRRVPKFQIVTVDQIFTRHPIELPGTLDPPEISRLAPPVSAPKKRRKAILGQTEMIFPLDNPQAPQMEATKRARQIRPVDIEVIRPDSSQRKRK